MTANALPCRDGAILSAARPGRSNTEAPSNYCVDIVTGYFPFTTATA